MTEFRKTRRLLIGVTLVFILFVLVYGFFLREVFVTNEALQSLEEDVTVQTGREEYLRSIKNVLLDTERERSEVSSRFISEEGVVSFIERVEELGRRGGVDLTVRSVDIVSDENKLSVYEWLELSVEVEGSWQGLYSVFALMENMPVALSFSGVRLSYSEQKSSEETVGSWHGSFNLRVAKNKE